MCTVHLGTLEYLVTTCAIPNLPANLLIALPIPTPQNTNLWPHCQRVILPPHTCLQPRSTCSTLGFGTFVPPKKRKKNKQPRQSTPLERCHRQIRHRRGTDYVHFPTALVGFQSKRRQWISSWKHMATHQQKKKRVRPRNVFLFIIPITKLM